MASATQRQALARVATNGPSWFANGSVIGCPEMSLEVLFGLADLEDLVRYLKHADEGRTRALLHAEFKRLVEYRNAREWAEYVEDSSSLPRGAKGHVFVRPRLAYGKLAKHQGVLRWLVDRHFPVAFADLGPKEQKRLFSNDLLQVLDELEIRLRDVQRILDGWQATTCSGNAE